MERSAKSRLAHLWLALIYTLLVSTGLSADEKGKMDWQPPSFEAADDGGRVFHYPADLDGPAIVLFWASWCPYCKALMPQLQSIADEYEGEIPVLALNFRDEDDPAEFLAEYGYDFRLFPNADPGRRLPGTARERGGHEALSESRPAGAVLGRAAAPGH